MSGDLGPAFGRLLRRYRRRAGLTQEQLAERAALSRFTVGALERGVNQRPRQETVDLMAQALGLDAAEHAALIAARRTPGAAGPDGELTAPFPLAADTAPLVGRAAELALLERHVRPEGPPLLALAGEPGIGKTRLLREGARMAAASGWCVLTGGCQRRGGQDPYAPLPEALQHYIRGRPPTQLGVELEGCGWLVRLLPDLADGPLAARPAGTVPAAHERRLMVAAVRRFLGNVAGPRGTLLVLDDLQWADPDALEVLAALLRWDAAPPLRLMGAYRDTEVQDGDGLSRMLADLAQAGLARQQHLGPLAPMDAARLLEHLTPQTPAPAVGATVLQRAGGVPFFLVSWAQALAAESGGHGDSVPWTVAQGVRDRVAALPPAARTLIGVAAVAGRAVSWPLLSALVGAPEPELLEALEAACRARLLEEDGAQGYRFVHDVIREVVEEHLGAARRALLHRRIAETLQGFPGAPPVDAIAYHYRHTDDRAATALWLERAGDHAVAAVAQGMAAAHYREALDYLDDVQQGPAAVRVRDKWSQVLRTQGRFAEALRVLEEAAALCVAAGDAEALGRIIAQSGAVLGDRGTPQEGITRVQQAVRQLESRSGPSPALARLYGTLAWLLLGSGDYPAQLRAAERAVALSGLVGDERGRAQAELWRAEALALLGRPAAALAAFEAAAALAEASGDLHTLSYVLPMIATSYRESDAGEAARQATRALAVADRWGDPVHLAWALNMQGSFAAVEGQWTQAHAAFARALALDRQVGGSFVSPYILAEMGRLALWEGRLAQAATHLEQSVAAASHASLSNLNALRLAQRLLAEHDVLVGTPTAAQARLRPLLDRPGLVEPDVTLLLPTLGWALLASGAVDAAERVAAEAEARARQLQLRDGLVEAVRVQALVRMQHERWPEAAALVAEGLALARRAPCFPYAEARLLHLGGQLEARVGRVQAARAHLQAARALFARLGAQRDAARAAQDLSAHAAAADPTGVSAHPPTDR